MSHNQCLVPGKEMFIASMLSFKTKLSTEMYKIGSNFLRSMFDHFLFYNNRVEKLFMVGNTICNKSKLFWILDVQFRRLQKPLLSFVLGDRWHLTVGPTWFYDHFMITISFLGTSWLSLRVVWQVICLMALVSL